MNNPRASDIEHRKAEHLDICIHGDVESPLVSTGLERYRFRHTCLPELDFDDLDIQTTFLGWPLAAPLLISSMTGGTALAGKINRRLARAAQHFRIPMGVGSQRVLLEQPQIAETFAVREVAPDTPLLANIGAVQLNYGCGVDDCGKIIKILDANALILHLNPLQEAVQTRGDRNFKGLLPKIRDLCQQLEVPVIVKEVGNGISGAIADQLIQAGVAAIDVAGAGGTSWAKVEAARATDPRQRALGQTFADWGIPTADCLQDIRENHPDYPLIASGGLKNGLDVAKAIALGADLGGLARPFLQAAHISEEALFEHIEITLGELKTVLFCTGCKNLSQLHQGSSLLRNP
ncbi:type 2 isopentenyl-diphosphate Delta-isomerase [Candidatus Synechococcus calcipolaris G9]|uniref:Isopentenyl-diphosphate delta-isomerase n=1 Tax=Candidatus Synechococcus calcipolaris G9 TaxID=1497997 RepID=A0ABT6EZ21_9SYNE|nr:type 2 isopentenyl-diphosphate Delta-isomerase [Candidatus Synechococcus calcipolaris]MDG2990648.1 type 2 isopentenyl-diphosphate Delta-isomerase [Candidatus Synechococcus calcipolaris G9]